MFTIPAILSIALDSTVVVTYFRNDLLFATESSRPLGDLVDLSTYTFDVAALAALRILFLFPYIWSCLHRLRLVYSFIPWTWLVFNMGVAAARMVFLMTGLVTFDVQYILVIMSMASVLLQTACFEHLRSSAPREKRIFLASSVNRADVSARLLDPTAPYGGGVGGGGELYDGHQEDVDFIEFITSKMKQAKQYWTDKTEALRDYLTDLSQGKDEQSLPFNLLLRLFKYDPDVLGELDELFNRDPASIEFYIPQLVTFLLYGAFWSSASLQDFLLDKCSRSVHFAHRLYWFLNASCLSGSGINMEGVGQVRCLIEEVVIRGQVAAKRLDEGRTQQEELMMAAATTGAGPADGAGGGGRGEGQQYREEEDKTDHGGNSFTTAHTCVEIGSLNSSDSDHLRQPLSSGSMTTTATTTTTNSSSSSSTALAKSRFPLEAGRYRGGDSDYFHVLPRFIDTLVQISQSLLSVPRDARTLTLRHKLRELGRSTLPCNVIYMPVGNTYHRVWRIHVVESSAFSTKERVPALVCFEVVDFERPHDDDDGKGGTTNNKKRWWSEMVDSMPNISHTFRLGTKEWTFKLGDKKGAADHDAGGGSSSSGAQAAGAEARQVPPEEDQQQQQQQQGVGVGGGDGGAMERRRSSSGDLLLPIGDEGGSGQVVAPLGSRQDHSGSFSAPVEVPGMGQWSSISKSASEDSTPAAVGGGGGGDKDDGRLVLTEEDLSAASGSSSSRRKRATIGSGEVDGGWSADSRAPLLEGGREAGAGKRRQQQATAAVAAPPSSEDKPGRAPSWSEFREEDKTPLPSSTATAQGGDDDMMSPLVVTDDYGTFTPPPPSPAYSEDDDHEALLMARQRGGDHHYGSGTSHASSSSTMTTAATTSSSAPQGSSSNVPSPGGPSPPVIFKEKWKQKEARIRRHSEIGHLPGWRLLPVIIKSNDDLRQEQFASQLLRQIDNIVRQAHVPVWLRPYDIIATSVDGGLLEAIPDTVSLDALRRNDARYTTLLNFFERLFGGKGSRRFNKARQCFVESMAAYSIICFLLQIKDRHNGNILLDAQGHIIHIDFGFLLARSPGNVNFERAPFKLTSEFVELMDGPRSPVFKRFRDLCVKTYMELRRQRHKIILLVEMVANGNENLPCFGGKPQSTVEALRQRFQPESNDRACIEYVHCLIDQSLDNWSTRWYDRYQSCFVGIA